MRANFHTHTTYCDGRLTPEEMVKAAIAHGCAALGFSGHSYEPIDELTCMSRDGTFEYMREIKQLREKYAGEIDIFLGIEQEPYYGRPTEGFDYIIGAVHYVKVGEGYVSVDDGAEAQRRAVYTYFGDDYYAMAERYFETVAKIDTADIIGHFDLITKYNFDGKLFDESHPRYVDAALSAMDEVLKSHRLFEVNTGAMFRFGKLEPYPSAFLLRELHKRGGEVILSSDSHDAESLCYKFDEMRDLLRGIGFKYVKCLTRDGFVDCRC